MDKIAIVTDSSCDIPKKIMEQHNIKMLALRIIYKNEEFRDRIEISPEEIYERFSEEIPTSSLPSPEDALNMFEGLIAEGYTHIIGIFISSGLSGTFNMVRNVIANVEGANIELIDSKSLSMGLGFPVLEAVREIEESNDFEKAVARARATIEKTETFYVIKTLEYLKKGGRIGKVEGTIGDLLNLKPIISVGKDGTYFTYRKVRGRKKSISELYTIALELIGDKKVNIAIVHGNSPEEGKVLAERLGAIDNVNEVMFDQISPVLSVHTGPGLVGFIVTEIEEEK